jgi:hypothetical protein
MKVNTEAVGEWVALTMKRCPEGFIHRRTHGSIALSQLAGDAGTTPAQVNESSGRRRGVQPSLPW